MNSLHIASLNALTSARSAIRLIPATFICIPLSAGSNPAFTASPSESIHIASAIPSVPIILFICLCVSN